MLITIIIDGPPAAGKSFLARKLSDVLYLPVIVYKAFGPFNIFAKFLFKSHVHTVKAKENIDFLRLDPFLMLSKCLLNKLSFIMMLFEIFYKLSQQIIILLFCVVKGGIIIDEFLAIRHANYINAFRYGALDKKFYYILFQLDLIFFRMFSKLSKLIYIYTDPSDYTLVEFWHMRGHKLPYSKNFLFLVRFSYKIVSNIISNHSINMKIKGTQLWLFLNSLLSG